MYYFIQQVPIRAFKTLCHGFTNWMTWNVIYNLFKEICVDTYRFLSYNCPVYQDSKVSLTTHRDFLKRESWLSDILASIFRCTSELDLWMTFIHRVITNIFPQGIANHRLTCIHYLRRKTFYC